VIAGLRELEAPAFAVRGAPLEVTVTERAAFTPGTDAEPVPP
jgi:hypothetical protein